MKKSELKLKHDIKEKAEFLFCFVAHHIPIQTDTTTASTTQPLYSPNLQTVMQEREKSKYESKNLKAALKIIYVLLDC